MSGQRRGKLYMSDVAYYRARARTHREAALGAAEPHIAAIHRDLAERYEAIVHGLDNEDIAYISNRSFDLSTAIEQ